MIVTAVFRMIAGACSLLDESSRVPTDVQCSIVFPRYSADLIYTNRLQRLELALATINSFLYHLRVMVKALPKRFNPDLLARDGTRFELNLPQSQMQRLSGILSSSENDIHVSALFSRRKHHIVIGGRLTTVFSVQCQRCLEPMDVEVSEPFELVFVENQDKAEELPKELDPVLLDEKGQIHVVDLFEDELILHVPEIPKHSDVAACELSQTEFGKLSADIEEGKSNPFEALKNLNLH